jgi:hypothetical protein
VNNISKISATTLASLCLLVDTRAADPLSAISIEEANIVANGASVAAIHPGTSLVILGEKADSGEFIVQHTLDNGQKIVGLVPRNAVVLSKATPSPTPSALTIPVQGKPGVLSALELSKEAKEDRTTFLTKHKGQQIKIFGLVEKATIENMAGGAETQPVITLATTTGLPKVRVRLSPSIAKDMTIINDYKYFPAWFYGYYGRKVEFRQSGMNQIQVRASYKSNSSYSNGTSLSSKHNTDWSPIFSPGDPMTVEGFVKGIGVDIELEGAFLVAPNR